MAAAMKEKSFLEMPVLPYGDRDPSLQEEKPNHPERGEECFDDAEDLAYQYVRKPKESTDATPSGRLITDPCCAHCVRLDYKIEWLLAKTKRNITKINTIEHKFAWWNKWYQDGDGFLRALYEHVVELHPTVIEVTLAWRVINPKVFWFKWDTGKAHTTDDIEQLTKQLMIDACDEDVRFEVVKAFE